MKNLLKFTPVIVAFSLLFTLTACWPAQTYDKNGISFKYPGGWVITEDESTNFQSYLSLEKTGSTPKATIIFGWLDMEANIGADMMLASILKEMQATESFTDFVAQPAIDTTYGSYPASAVSYTAKVNGVPMSGAVWVFSAEGKVVNVAVREGANKVNVKDFKKIKDSFALK